MANSPMDELARESAEQTKLLADLLQEFKKQGENKLKVGVPSSPNAPAVPAGAGEAGGFSGGGSSSGGGSGGGGSSSSSSNQAPSRFRQQLTNQAAAAAAGFTDPLRPKVSTGLSTAENLLTLVAGTLAGDKGASAAQSLVGAGKNLSGGRVGERVLENTISDVYSTVNSLSAQGLRLGKTGLDQLVESAKEKNQFFTDNIVDANASIDRVFGGALTNAAASEAEKVRLLGEIAANTGSSKNRPESGLRGGQ